MFAIYVYIHEEDVFQDAQNKKKTNPALPVLSETCLAYFVKFPWMQFHVECGGFTPCPTGDRRLCQRSVLLGGIGCLMVGLGFC